MHEDDQCCCGGHGHENEGGCCGGHDHHDHDGGCCGGHGHDHEGGCCGGHGDGGCGCGCHDDGLDQVAMFVVGPLETNCYVYESQGEMLLVDAGNSGAAIAETLGPVNLKYIVATHGHGDHVGGVKALREITGATYCIHGADAEIAQHAGEVSETGRSYDDNAPEPDLVLKDGDTLTVGTATFRVIETPGHTPGCIVLLGEGTAEGLAFMGDTLFKGSAGRTDLTGGDAEVQKATMERLKSEISPDTTLLCGHGDPTYMLEELANNPFLR